MICDVREARRDLAMEVREEEEGEGEEEEDEDMMKF
jgi:hypothetical protein